MSTNDLDYYREYYNDVDVYVGEKWKHTSRFLVFKDWLRSYLKPGAKVLDIGCGDAIFAELMPEFQWHGIDINIERASKRIMAQPGIDTPEGALVPWDLMKPPYPWPDKYFDAIVCSEVLEHLWDLRIVHKEAKRLLKRDGVYVISTPNFDWLQNHLESYRPIMTDFAKCWTVEHVRHYNFDSHKRFLNEVGFVVEKHTGADGHFDPITANICHTIQKRLREKGVETNLEELHKFAGEAIPHYSHTCIIAARKA